METIIIILLITLLISLGLNTTGYFIERFLFSLMYVLMGFLILYLIEVSFFNGEIINSKIEKANKEFIRSAELEGNYLFYYLENEQVKYIKIDKGENINIKRQGKIPYVYYKLKKTRNGKVIKDKKNIVNVILPLNLEIEKRKTGFSKEDLIFKRITKNNCFDRVKYENNQFNFYKIKDKLIKYSFKETEVFKLNFLKMKDNVSKICLDLDYYETLNKEIIKVNGHVNKFNINVGKEFNTDNIL